MKVMTVLGTRPEVIRLSLIIDKLDQVTDHVLVHTGQHYDESMSDQFFADLNIPKPDAHLGAGSGSHAAQTAEIIRRFEEVLLHEQPEVLVVVGDVNSTLACSIVASKIQYSSGGRPLIAHVEAGLRSFDRSMPEEINRIVTDHLADLLFVTEQSGLNNLRREGVEEDKLHFVGNTMIDSLLAFEHAADQSHVLDELRLRRSIPEKESKEEVDRFALLTLHRPSNVDRRESFLAILNGLENLAHTCPIIFPAHPRTKKRITEFGLEEFFDFQDGSGDAGCVPATATARGRFQLVPPLGYLDFLCLMKHAAVVVTDSGGIQEETTCLGVPCVTVRENTERPVTVEFGTNVLAGTSVEGIRDATLRQLDSVRQRRPPEGWDGKSAERILAVILREAMKLQSQ